MKININDNVRVKLTPHGEIILAMDEYASDKPDADGWLEMQLWELMRVFGPVMFVGNPNLPFENNVIELVTPINDAIAKKAAALIKGGSTFTQEDREEMAKAILSLVLVSA